MTDSEKIAAIRSAISETLTIYPGHEAMSLIHKILDIINDQSS